MLTVHASAFTFLCICGSYRITAFDFFSLYIYATYVNPPSECGCYEFYTLTILLLAFNSCLKRYRIAYPRLHSNCMCICHSACASWDSFHALLSLQTVSYGCSVCNQGGTHSFLRQPPGQRHRLQVWPPVCPFNEQLWLQVVWGQSVTCWSGNAPKH